MTNPDPGHPAAPAVSAGAPAGAPAESFVDAHGVDLGRPLYSQIPALGERYWAWVHEGVGVKTLKRLAAVDAGRWPGSVRIFDQDFLETMTHIPWQLVLAIWVPVAAGMLAAARFGLGMPWSELVGLAVSGLVLWTLVEYVLHRGVFHHEPRSLFGRRLHFLAHGIHHLDPWDPTRLVFPPLAALGIAAVLFGLLLLVLPVDRTLAMFAGLLVGYLAYDMSHYYSHHGKPRSRWGKFLRRYHLAHHHKEQDRLFGVSQPFWDIVFRTGERRGA